MKEKLWTRNFLLMFSGSVISALGSIGLNVALGVIIYDKTQSTILSSIFVAITMIPNLILPMIVGSVVDKKDPLKLLLANEKVLLLLYGLLLMITLKWDFNYMVYLVSFTLISSLGVISEISGQSMTAQLLKPEVMSKGYAIMSTIYPLCNVIVAPLALVIYKNFGMASILIIYIVLSLVDIILESNIKHPFKFNENTATTFKEIRKDMMSGLEYINTFTPLKAVFIFFTVVIIANGSSTLIYPYFEKSSHLSLEGYALLMSVNSLGYMFGGFFHSMVEIPKRFRYSAAMVIYFLFIVMDASLLFVPFTAMLVFRFILGLSGMNSANIRNTAVQASIADEQRGKVNGVFSMLMGLAGIVGNLLFGFLGASIAIPYLMIFAQGIYLAVVLLIFINPKYKIKAFYNLEYSKH